MNYKETLIDFSKELSIELAKKMPYVGWLIRVFANAKAKQHAKQQMLEDRAKLLEEIRNILKTELKGKHLKDADLLLDVISKEENSAIISTGLQVQAKKSGYLEEGSAQPKTRFVYLASRQFATSIRTAEIAAQHGFLWRSYHADRQPVQAIPRVVDIKAGDLIVLAYREKGHFFILAPLVVMNKSAGNEPIHDEEYDCGEKDNNPHRHAPFVLATPALGQILLDEGYGADSVFTRQCGLNVRVLLSDVTQADARLVMQRRFPSPGRNPIWNHDHENIPAELREWIASL